MCLLELLGMVFVTVECVGLCWGCIVVMLVCAPKCGTAVARGVVCVSVAVDCVSGCLGVRGYVWNNRGLV